MADFLSGKWLLRPRGDSERAALTAANALKDRPAPHQIQNVQYLRAFSAVAIVMFHASVHYNQPIHVGDARVAVFFIMSGFVLWLITQGRANDPRQFLARRIARLAPLYWLVTLVVFGKEALGWTTHAPATVRQLVLSLFLIPHVNNAGKIFPVLIPGWTLVLEMFFCVLLTALLYVKQAHRMFVAVCLFGGLTAIGLIFRPTGAIAVTYTSFINLDFLAGLVLASVWPRVRLPQPAALGLLSVGIACSLVPLPIQPGPWTAAATGLFSGMIVAGALGLERPGARPIRWLKVIGDRAYSIYLWHLPVQSVVWALLSRLGVHSVPLGILVATVASTAFGMVAYVWLEKPLTDFLFAWLDRRFRAKPRETSIAEMPLPSKVG